MKFLIKGKTEDGKWIIWNYYTCNTIDDLKSKMSNLLLVSKYIGVDATRIE